MAGQKKIGEQRKNKKKEKGWRDTMRKALVFLVFDLASIYGTSNTPGVISESRARSKP